MADLFSVESYSVTPFTFGKFPVRVIQRDGEPWFVAADVARALEYRDAEVAARHLKAHQKGVHPTGVPGQSLTVINESGLYRLVLRSRKPSAELFSDWVTGEVLPSIRKTGGYQQPVNMSKAMAAANEVAAQMQAVVFDAILNGTSNWQLQRLMVSFNVGRDGALTPRVDLIEHEAIVMTLAHLAKAIIEPGGMLPSNSELANLAAACNKRLAQRIEFADSRKALSNN